MPEFNAPRQGMDFAAFSAHRRGLLGQGWQGLDAGNTELYTTLAQRHPARFGAIAPSTHKQAPYRCHLAEAFLDHLQLDHAATKPHALISQGVRHSLDLILRTHQQAAWWLPSDVYPVYASIAQGAGVTHHGYASREGLPWEALQSTIGWGLLVCDPLKPWSTQLDEANLLALAQLATRQQGVVLIDAAYDLDALRRFPNFCQDSIAFMGSLSKGWLLPYRAGLVLTSRALADAWRPAFQAASKDEGKTREAFAALREHAHRPADVQDAIAAARSRLLAHLQNLGTTVSHAQGYWVNTPHSPEELFEQGILSIPASVFGSTLRGSVLSAVDLVA